MSHKAIMSTTNGVPPYPTPGKKPAKIKLPQSRNDSMNVCATCGMGEDANPAHGADYSGKGKHSFDAETKSLDQLETEDSQVIIFGGACKALGEGKIGGFGILHTTNQDPDTTQDYFDKETDYWVVEGDNKSFRPVIYDHGLDATLKSKLLARGRVEIKDAGVWCEAQLDLRDAYNRYIYQMAKDGDLGWSTGSAPHLVKRERVGKSYHVKSWPLVEFSLTPMPIEPRTEAVALKSYSEETRKDIFKDIKADDEGDGSLAPHEFMADEDKEGMCKVCGKDFKSGNHAGMKALRPMKSVFSDALDEKSQSSYELRDALDKVFNEILMARKSSGITGVNIDLKAKVKEAIDEYAGRLTDLAVCQMTKYEEGGYTDPYSVNPSGASPFYLRSFDASALISFLSSSVKGQLVSGSALDEHSAAVVSALGEYVALNDSLLEGVKSWCDRVKDKIEFRANSEQKSGRVISAATLKKIAEIHERVTSQQSSLTDLSGIIQALRELAAPKKPALTESDRQAMLMTIAEAEHLNEMAGLPS